MKKLPLISMVQKIFFIISVLLFIYSVDANLVEDSCKKAADNDPNLDYKFCVKFLEETQNVTTQNTTTLPGFAIISINQTIQYASAVNSLITELLNETNIDNHTKACLQDCLELYLGAKSSLQDALKDIESKDLGKANSDLSAALDAPGTCEDGFNEDHRKNQGGDVNSTLTTESHIFFQMTLVPLAFLKMLSS